MASLKNLTSILDIISDRQSPVLRRLSDINSGIEGTATQLLRIRRVVSPHLKQTNSKQRLSVLGDFNEELTMLDTDLLSNIIVKYPFSNTEYFQNLSNDNQTEPFEISSIDVNEILPIIATFIFEGKFNSADKDPLQLKKGDIIVDIFYDENQNAIPIPLEIGRTRGAWFGKNIVTKSCELSIRRGKLPKDVQPLVEKYITDMTIKKQTIRSQRF